MINWILVTSVVVGGTIGAEFGRRRAIRRDRPVSLMPVWHLRLLYFLGCAGVAMSFETARVALETPTRDHVLHLVLAGLFTLVVLGVHHARDLTLFSKELARRQSD